MPKPNAALSEKKKKSSLDYPLLAKKLIEASGDAGISKLPAGLYIVATPIGHLGDITMRGLLTLAGADMIACEDTRTSGAMLSKFGIKQKLISYHDHSGDARRDELMKHLTAGQSVALISDAGMPLIADPGYRLVRDCRDQDIDVFVIPGANAAITALAGSGLPTDHFYFGGFLPPKTVARKKAAALIKDMAATLVFYEAPQRLKETLRDLADVMGPVRKAAVARELTKLFEETKSGNLAELAEFYTDHDVKGEIVIIIEPPADVAVTEQDLDDVLRNYLRSMSVRDAAAAACAVTGLKKSEVYARALWLAGKNSG